MEPTAFQPWLNRFLPELDAQQPATLFTPATVSDPTDGQIGHLHGLNLSRAWCFCRIASGLPADDARVAPLLTAAERHAAASLPFVIGHNYMLEHWLTFYAVLLLGVDQD